MNPPGESLRLRWARTLQGRDADDYDGFVARAAGGHYAQARGWADVARAGRPFAPSFVLARAQGGDSDGAGDGAVVGAAMVLRASWRGLPLPYAVVERGPVVDSPARLRPFLRLLARAARRRGIARLSVMPYWEASDGSPVQQTLRALGWQEVQRPDGQHVRTLRVATAGKTDEQLFAGSAFATLRRKLRAAEQSGARARRGSAADLPAFAGLYNALMQRQQRAGKSAAWLRALAARDFGVDGDVGLFFTELEGGGGALATALTVRHGRLVTFALGAADEAPSKISKMVPAMVAAIHWARDVGADFDLGGIPVDGDTDPKRQSIAQFKRDFAQAPVALLGQHARWLW